MNVGEFLKKGDMDEMHGCDVALKGLLSEGSIRVLNEYLDEQQSTFEALANATSDHSHEQYQIYQSYIKLVECLVLKVCKQNEIEVHQLHKYIRENSDVDPYIQLFSEIFVKINEYDIFHEYIRDTCKRKYLFQIIKGYNN